MFPKREAAGFHGVRRWRRLLIKLSAVGKMGLHTTLLVLSVSRLEDMLIYPLVTNWSPKMTTGTSDNQWIYGIYDGTLLPFYVPRFQGARIGLLCPLKCQI